MGLLDFYGDPQANLALAAGLLSGGNFGSAMGRGLAGAQAVMTAEEERKRRNELALAQAEELRSRAEERQMKINASNRLDRLTSGLFQGGKQGTGDAFMPGAPSNPTNTPNTPQQAMGWLARASLDDVAALKVAGGPDLLEQWKLMHIGSSVPAGGYRITADGKREYMVDPSKPFTVENGQIGLAPGASNVPLFQGAVKAAETAGVNENTLLPPDRPGLDGRPILGTVGQFVRQATATQNAPRNPNALIQPGDGSNQGERNAIFMRELESAKARLSSAKNPAEIARAQQDIESISNEIKRNGGAAPASSPFASKAELIKAEEQAKADVVRGEATKTKLTKADEMLYGIARAKELLGQGPTESLIGAGVDKAFSLVGKSTKSADVASQLEALSGWMVSNVPRMEGPQSNFDVDNYRTMAGKVGDRTLPISARLAAANEVERLQRKYANLNSDIAETAMPAGQVNKSAAKLPANPKPSDLTIGQSYTLPNGRVGVWDGMGFKAE